MQKILAEQYKLEIQGN